MSDIRDINLNDIIPNRFQPREFFDQEALQSLADSIKEHGVIEPIIVRPVDNKFEIVAGERRYKASTLAGKTTIPAIVKELSDKESAILAFIENNKREDVSPIEEARTCLRILKMNNMTQEELAKRIGMSQSTLANKLRLLSLPNEVQDAVLKGDITEKHARVLLTVKEVVKQLTLLNMIKENHLTVRELEREIAKMNGDLNKNTSQNNVFINYSDQDHNNNLNVSSPNNNSFIMPGGSTDQAVDDFLNTDNNFMNFEDNNRVQSNNYLDDVQNDSNVSLMSDNITVNNSETPVASDDLTRFTSDAPSEDNGEFMSFLNGNNFDNLVDAPQQTPSTNEEANDDNFMSFLNGNSFDNLVDQPQGASTTSAPANDDFMNFLNGNNNTTTDNNQSFIDDRPIETNPNFVDNNPVEEPENDDNFMSFLNGNSFDNLVDQPTSNEPVSQEKESSVSDFSQNLNFDSDKSNNVVNNEPISSDIFDDSDDSDDSGSGDFLDNMKVDDNMNANNNTSFIDFSGDDNSFNPMSMQNEIVDYTSKYKNYEEPPTPVEDDLIEEDDYMSTPMDKEAYVESGKDFVDITNTITMTSIDEIIEELRTVVDRIKHSKYKVETDEVDFDDIFQITIKIDKRDF